MVVCKTTGFLPKSIVTYSLFSQFEWNSLADFDYKEPGILIVWERKGVDSVGKMENGQPPGFSDCLFCKYEDSKTLVVSTEHLRYDHTSMAAIHICSGSLLH